MLKRPQFSKPDPAIGGVWKKADFDAGITGLHSAILPSAPNGSIWFLSCHNPTGHGHHSPQPAHEGESRVLDLNSDPPTVTTPAHSGAHLPNLFCGGQAFLGEGRLLMVGGDRETPERLQMLHTFTPAGANGGTWRREDSMVAGRRYPTAVTLPDGRVLTIAGDTRKPAGTLNSTYKIFGPANKRVEPPVPAPLSGFGEFATYPFVFVLPNHKLMPHGGMRTVFLLPDATVMTSGTDATWNPGNIPESIKDLEVFEPPYLHTGDDRPKITAAPEHLRYGITFTVSTPAASSISDVALMRNGSCTHSFNSDQRHVGLKIVRLIETR